MTIVPHTALGPDVLIALIEEFVTRDGAVHGHADHSASQRVELIRSQLESGLVKIVFDEENETCTIVPAKSLPRE